MADPNPAPPVEVAILIVCHNAVPYLDECLRSVLASDDRCHGQPLTKQVVVVDNASQDCTAQKIKSDYSQVDLLHSDENLGFAGGNNLAWQHARKMYPRTRYICMLNQDTVVADGYLGPLLDWLETHPGTGSVQPLLMLHPQTHLINTARNRCHYLGFGLMGDYGRPEAGNLSNQSMDYTSGAAAVVRADLIDRYGLFEPHMFMYLEDVDLSWRLRMLGHAHYLVPASKVYHKYSPGIPLQFYECIERNRWWLMLVYYKFPTLLLLLPAILLMELLQLLFAAAHGHLGAKFSSCHFFLRKKHRDHLRQQRRWIQKSRVISDRVFLGGFSGTIQYPTLKNPVLRYVINPIFAGYWFLVRWLIRW